MTAWYFFGWYPYSVRLQTCQVVILDQKIKAYLTSNSGKILLLLFFILGISLFEILSRFVIGPEIVIYYFSDGYFEFEPSQSGWMGFTYSKTRINSLGYRGPELDLTKKEKTLFLGDSFTYGYLLYENETIPYYYGLEFADNQSINGGVPSYGLGHMRIRYARSPIKDDLDFVIVILIKEDFYRLIEKKVNSPEKVVLRQFKKISVLASVVELELKRFATNLRIALYVLGFIRDEDFPPVQYEPFSDEHNLQKLLDFDAEIKKNNSVPVFVFYEFEKSNYSESAEAFCVVENLNCITDVPSAFAGMPLSSLKLYDNAHPSSESNEAVAKHIGNYLRQGFGVPIS